MSEQKNADMEEKRTNAETIETTLDEINELIKEGDIGELPRRAREVTGLFKSHLFHDDHERLWSYYQSLWDIVKEKWAQNATRLREELDDLEELVNDENQTDFRPKSEKISSLFKELRISREDNEVLWQRLQRSHRVMAEKRKQFRTDSEYNRSAILADTSSIKNKTLHLFDPEELHEVSEMLNGIREKIRTLPLVKPHKDECWDEVREAQEYISSARTRLQETAYDEFKCELSEISSSFNARGILETLGETETEWFDSEIQKLKETQDHIKEQQQALKIAFVTKEQRGYIREELQFSWQVSVKDLHKLYEAKNEHYRKKHGDWVERTESKISKLEEFIENNDGFIETLQRQTEDLEEKIDSAWNEQFAEKARGWVQQKHDKIAEVEQKNEGLRNQIQEMRNKLDN